MNDGDLVADFELLDDRGEPRRLSEFLAKGPVVLFFYPAAMTGGCTAESCHFRDLAAEFAKVGAQRVGISMDPVAKQGQFTKMHGFDYPLLADVEGVVSKQYGVRRGGLLGKLAPTAGSPPDGVPGHGGREWLWSDRNHYVRHVLSG